jgi:hypothetical protein
MRVNHEKQIKTTRTNGPAQMWQSFEDPGEGKRVQKIRKEATRIKATLTQHS